MKVVNKVIKSWTVLEKQYKWMLLGNIVYKYICIFIYICMFISYMCTHMWKTILLVETSTEETLYIMAGYEGVVNFSSSLGRQSSNTDHKF